MTAISIKRITAAELLKMGDIGRCELIYGELVMISPAGFDHGEIALRIGSLLLDYVEERDLGVVLAAETGFKIESNPDLVRAPDASFIRKNRVPKTPWRKYFPGVPDLAVEVLSPEDGRREIAEKVNMWLAHGTISCWVADPETRTLTIYRAAQTPIRLSTSNKITHEPTLPGLVLPISKIFKRP
jgi:Uma2 family endonuclease